MISDDNICHVFVCVSHLFVFLFDFE